MRLERSAIIGGAAWILKGPLECWRSPMFQTFPITYLVDHVDVIIPATISILLAGVVIFCWTTIFSILFRFGKWIFRAGSIKKLLMSDRAFRLYFNPATGASKVIRFCEGGIVGGGNHNEHRWRLHRGRLELLASDGQIFSRFRLDPKDGQLKRTDDPDCRSKPGQYILAE